DRRGAELRTPGDPSRSAQLGRGGVLLARTGGGRTWLTRRPTPGGLPMPEPQRGMGRGLAAILSISEAAARADAPELRDLAVELIRPNPVQPRKRFDEDGLNALAESLAERGVLQPVLVRPRPGGSYELVAGERRWRAAKLAGLETMPALVQHRDDDASLE